MLRKEKFISVRLPITLYRDLQKFVESDESLKISDVIRIATREFLNKKMREKLEEQTTKKKTLAVYKKF